MSVFELFASQRARLSKTIRKPRKAGLFLESLEDRALMSASTISGFVYNDANNNGLKDPGELAIANSTVELHNAANVVIATAVSDANGFYQFDHDDSIDNTPKTLTKTVEFAETKTNFSLQGTLQQFDPSLGTLVSVEIKHEGAITSEIKVENTSDTSDSQINGTIAGNLTLEAPGVKDKLTLAAYAGSFNAKIYDGTQDYQGDSGTTFGKKTADGSNTITLTGADITAYLGTGTVNVRETAIAASKADGGGNLVALIQSTAKSKITVVYHYTPNNTLQPGQYKVVQNPQPPGYFDGQESSGGVVLNHPPGTDTIAITLDPAGTSANNNFGELKAASIAGKVYVDANNNGVWDAGEAAIAGATITLTGVSDQGPVNLTTNTAADGAYKFVGLRPGNYTVTETQPDGYIDGKDAIGTPGGTASNDQFTNIQLPAGFDGVENNFGERLPAKLSGFVYVDANDDGIRGPGEAPIMAVKLTLSGTDQDGNAVTQSALTDANGFYQFATLPPGTYAVTEEQPLGYGDGKDTIGTAGGTVANDYLSAIVLGVGALSENNNFGEKIVARADLAISKVPGSTVSSPGDKLTYLVGVSNLGDFTAQNVRVVDNLPVGAAFVSASGAGWTIAQANGVVTATRASQAVGEDTWFTVTVKVNGVANTLTNRADVSSDTPDDNPNNNHKDVTTRVVDPATPTLKPLDIQLQGTPIIGKGQLLGPDSGKYLDPALKSNMAFIAGVYKTLTGSQSDTNTSLTALLELQAGASRAVLVSNVWSTDAHLSQQATSVYKDVLNRAPSVGEKASAVQTLRSSGSEAALKQTLFTSLEYQQSHPSSQALAAGLYKDIYGRLPDLATTQSLVQSMGNGTLGDLVHNMLTTDESLQNQVNDTYRSVLRRDATPAETSMWGSQLRTGLSSEAALGKWLLSSAEFAQLALNAVK